MSGFAAWAAVLAAGAAGALLGRLLRLPMWAFSGSLIGVAVLHGWVDIQLATPSWWSLTAQILVGTAVGSKLDGGVLRRFRAAMPGGLLVVCVLVPAGVALGVLLHADSGIPLLDSVLGMVPGGVAEMVAASTSLHGNSALVAAIHVTRLVTVVWVTS